MSRIALVTGGAGYIGAHLVHGLQAQGWTVVVLDDLSTGVRKAVPPTARFVRGDVADAALLATLLAEQRPQAVFHLAAFTSAPASVAEPLRCYRANVEASRVLIEAIVAAPDPPAVVFSSSAAVYGSPEQVRVSETTPTLPINPYGASKLMTERMLADAANAYGLRHVSLRYFNVVGRGAGVSGGAGRAAAPGSLLDVALQVARGERAFTPVFGLDHPTRDGSGVRDFIHVEDLVDAHIAALTLVEARSGPSVLNCGYGRGASVLELLAEVEAASGRPIARRIEARRAGDPSEVVADPRLILSATDWRPRRQSLARMVGDAWSGGAAEAATDREVATRATRAEMGAIRPEPHDIG